MNVAVITLIPSLIKGDTVETALLNRLVVFVGDFTGVPHDSISQNTTLYGDLGIDGDDAVDLIADLKREFSIDFSDFLFDRHFGTEGLTPFAFVQWFTYAIRTGTPEARAGLSPIRICDLVDAAQTGKWLGLPNAAARASNA